MYDGDELDQQRQTGAGSVTDYCQRLLAQLQRQVVRYDLDTPKTEALIHLASTATASPSQNSVQVAATLMRGWKESGMITNDHHAEDAAIVGVLQAMPGVSSAHVLRDGANLKRIKVHVHGQRTGYVAF